MMCEVICAAEVNYINSQRCVLHACVRECVFACARTIVCVCVCVCARARARLCARVRVCACVCTVHAPEEAVAECVWS